MGKMAFLLRRSRSRDKNNSCFIMSHYIENATSGQDAWVGVGSEKVLATVRVRPKGKGCGERAEQLSEQREHVERQHDVTDERPFL